MPTAAVSAPKRTWSAERLEDPVLCEEDARRATTVIAIASRRRLKSAYEPANDARRASRPSSGRAAKHQIAAASPFLSP